MSAFAEPINCPIFVEGYRRGVCHWVVVADAVEISAVARVALVGYDDSIVGAAFLSYSPQANP